jgi:hypothetical protein
MLAISAVFSPFLVPFRFLDYFSGLAQDDGDYHFRRFVLLLLLYVRRGEQVDGIVDGYLSAYFFASLSSYKDTCPGGKGIKKHHKRCKCAGWPSS